jgi:queuine tRNA-ribosyltransferase
LYGIVQGGVYPDLRQESVDFINAHPFFGTAIGGSLGDRRQTMHEVVGLTRAAVRDDRPVHLLGIGGVRDIFHGVRCGIDSFDCVHPTRIARHGGALVKAAHWGETPLESPNAPMTLKRRGGKLTPLESRSVREHINVSKARFRWDPRPIDPDCHCYCCSNFSRSYLHHLFKARESLGGTLVSMHNVRFMNTLMADIREGILSDSLDLVEQKYVHPTLTESAYKGGAESLGS